MPLTKIQKNQLRGSLIIQTNLKHEIEEKWDSFSQNKQNAILSMLNLSSEAQNALLEKATQKQKNFPSDLKRFLANTQKCRDVKTEAAEKLTETQEMDSIISQIQTK